MYCLTWSSPARVGGSSHEPNWEMLRHCRLNHIGAGGERAGRSWSLFLLVVDVTSHNRFGTKLRKNRFSKPHATVLRWVEEAMSGAGLEPPEPVRVMERAPCALEYESIVLAMAA
jgi:hypothetical protein